MRAGKTLAQIERIRDFCEQDKTVLVAGLKDPKHYLELLGLGYVAEPQYMAPSLTNEFHTYENKMVQYLPTLMGFMFKKIQ